MEKEDSQAEYKVGKKVIIDSATASVNKDDAGFPIDSALIKSTSDKVSSNTCTNIWDGNREFPWEICRGHFNGSVLDPEMTSKDQAKVFPYWEGTF